jgi:hypothetical protein
LCNLTFSKYDLRKKSLNTRITKFVEQTNHNHSHNNHGAADHDKQKLSDLSDDDSDEDDIEMLTSADRQAEKIRKKIKKELAHSLRRYKGLPYMLTERYFTDAFILNEDSAGFSQLEDDHVKRANITKPPKVTLSAYRETVTENEGEVKRDIREELYKQWAKITNLFRFQPMWLIREYYGEQFALYFAWLGILISTLWVPTLFGIGGFIYGLQDTIRTTNASYISSLNATGLSNAAIYGNYYLNIFARSFDNNFTPYFAV